MPGEFEEERPTLLTCLACGGDWEWRYTKDGVEYVIACRHCYRGGMTRDQQAQWLARSGNPK